MRKDLQKQDNFWGGPPPALSLSLTLYRQPNLCIPLSSRFIRSNEQILQTLLSLLLLPLHLLFPLLLLPLLPVLQTVLTTHQSLCVWGSQVALWLHLQSLCGAHLAAHFWVSICTFAPKKQGNWVPSSTVDSPTSLCCWRNYSSGEPSHTLVAFSNPPTPLRDTPLPPHTEMLEAHHAQPPSHIMLSSGTL